MADNNSELLIKIKTILESGGVDQAKAKLNELITAQSGNNAVLAVNKAATDAVAKSQAAANKELEAATRAAWAMRQASTGSAEGLKGLTGAAASLGANMGSLVARISMVGAAFAAGWKVGDMIRRELIDPLWETKDKASASAEAAKQAAAKYRELNGVSLANLVKELQGIKATTDDLISSIERVYARQKELESARSSAAIAQIIATQPEGPERDKAIAQVRYAETVGAAESDIAVANRTITNNSNALNAADSKVAAVAASNEQTWAKQAAAVEAARRNGEGVDNAEYTQAAREFRLAKENGEKALKEAGEERRKLQAQLSESTQKAQNDIDIANQRIAQAKAEKAAADAAADAKISERTLQTTVAEPGRDTEAGKAIAGGRANRAARDAYEQVLPYTAESDGTFSPRGGRATQAAARQAISAAAKRIAEGGNEAEIFNELTAKLTEMGAVMSSGIAGLAQAMDQIDGQIGNLKTELANLKQRERVAKGVEQ